jgi:lysophospholipase L1-like esterase
MTNICIFGDSIVQGVYDEYAPSWAEIVKMRFHASGEGHVSTFGISGDDSRGLLLRMGSTLEAAQACWSDNIGRIVIAIGTNDARETLDESTGVFSMNTEIVPFEENVRELVAIAKRHSPSVLLVGLLHADDAKTLTRSRSSGRIRRYRENVLREYDTIVRQVTESENCGYVEFADMTDLADLPDGLHPNAAAHEHMADRFMKYLSRG